MNKNRQGAHCFVALMSLISKLSSGDGTLLELFPESGPEINVVLNFAILILLVRFTWVQAEGEKLSYNFRIWPMLWTSWQCRNVQLSQSKGSRYDKPIAHSLSFLFFWSEFNIHEQCQINRKISSPYPHYAKVLHNLIQNKQIWLYINLSKNNSNVVLIVVSNFSMGFMNQPV